MTLLESIRERAKEVNQRLVFPEGNDSRVLQAAHELAAKGIVEPILLGKEEEIAGIAAQSGVPIGDIEIRDPSEYLS